MATYTAASAAYADVETQIALAIAGDTVNIPAGEETWSTRLTLPEGINLIGAGRDSTIITGTGTTGILNPYLYGGSETDSQFRISGIGFVYTTNDSGGSAIYIDARYVAFATRIRIDHCRFTKGTRAIYSNGWVKGVVDNNIFLNNNGSLMVVGDGNTSWGRTIDAGTDDAIFYEDNTFITNSDSDREPGYFLYHQNGGRTVLRYNTFTTTLYTAGTTYWIDSHGNQNYYAGSGDFRGQPLIEIYENTIDVYQANELVYFRGGSIIFHDNDMTVETGSAPYIRLTEEESWQPLFFDPLRTEWPAEDQIMNSFFWNNTSNGTPITGVSLKNANDATFIQEDRDYFMAEPASSGGSESYPTRAGADDMTFTAEGANAYYPYTPYTYPHPLRGVSFHRNRMRIF